MIQDTRTPQSATLSPNSSLYHHDFYRWTEQMSQMLRSGQLQQLDIENLAAEIECLGKSERRELENRLIVLLMHLLKWQYQPERRSGSWKGTIVEQRFRMRRLLRDSPSLRPEIAFYLAECYGDARQQAASGSEIDPIIFPEICPWAVADVLSDEFFPDEHGTTVVH